MNQEVFDFLLTAYEINEYTTSGKIQQIVRVLSFSASAIAFILAKIGLYPLVSFILGIVFSAVWYVFTIVHIIQVIRDWKDRLYDGKIQWNAIAILGCVYSFIAAGAFFILAKIGFYHLASLIMGIACGAVGSISLIVYLVQAIVEWIEMYHNEHNEK